MQITKIEPTPSPNTMKISLDEQLSFGVSHHYNDKNKHQAPPIIAQMFAIDGVKSVYHVADFLAVDRHAKYEWQPILAHIRQLFGMEAVAPSASSVRAGEGGDIQVYVQTIYGFPMQLKLVSGDEERRVGLPDRFKAAALQAQTFIANIVEERAWRDRGVRYGTWEQVGEQLIEELEALYPERRLTNMLQRIEAGERGQLETKRNEPVTIEQFLTPDWKVRFALLDQLHATEADLPLLSFALKDEKMAIRRLAVAYLGMIGGDAVVPFLMKALRDEAAAVRRTAGDCLSDIGSIEALEAMTATLSDASKIVRWRAAMFLYEYGTEAQLAALRAAETDSEFEVQLQVKMAIERIETGEEAQGSIWKQMTELREAGK